MAKRVLKKGLAKFFVWLRELESNQTEFTQPEYERWGVSETGLKLDTVRTYRSKYLNGRVIFPSDNDEVKLCVRGVLAMSEREFAEVMTQSKASKPLPFPTTQERFREELHHLIALAEERNFTISNEDKRRLLALCEKQQTLDL